MIRRKPESIALTCLSAGFLIWSVLFISHSAFVCIDGRLRFCLFDDAMISMRYAWNLSHGQGLVWNPGERVEGYTNLLMTLLMSFSTLVFEKSLAVLFIQVLGIAFMLGIAVLSAKIADLVVQTGSDRRQALVRVLSFLCALTYYPLAYWSLMGMETGLLTMLLLATVLFTLRYIESGTRTLLFRISLLLGLAYLARNDAIIFAIPIGAIIGWESIRRGHGPWFRSLLPAIGVTFLFILGQSIFRFLYYGEWLPNTYTLKLTGMPLSARIDNGFGFITPFLSETGPILILCCLEALVAWRTRKALLLTIVLSAIAYQVYVGGDPWPYWRLVSPAIPLLGILLIDSLQAIVNAVSTTRTFEVYFLRNPVIPARHVPEALLALLVLLGMAQVNQRFTPEFSFRERPYQVLSNWYNVNTAVALDQVTTRDATVGLLWAGAIPYYSERRAIDFFGRSDKHVARLAPDLSGKAGWNGMTSVPGHNKYDLNYSIAVLRPTYVQRFDWCSQDLSEWGKSFYATLYYRGVNLSLLRGSPAVLWVKAYGP